MTHQAGRGVIVALAALLFWGCAPSGRGVIVFCAGDSLTEAAYPRDLRRILAAEGISARVLNHGRSGMTSGEYLNHLVRERARLIEEKPDVVLLQLGTNDVRIDGDSTPVEKFRENMEGILGVFRTFRSRSGKIPVILLATVPDTPVTPPNFDASSARRVRDEINPAIRDLAAAEGIAVVDQHAVFVRRPELLPEVHPLREGYRLMAEAWREALRRLD